MKQTASIILTVFILLTSSSAFAEFVFLKSGKVIEGKIVQDRANAIVVNKKEGGQVEVSRGDIMRLYYTQMYTGKLSVMKTNEEVFDAFIVDEDQKTVTFRKEWERPQEFTLERDSILFTTRKNPTSLQCEVRDGAVELSWLPPYMRVRSYNIYFREEGGEYKRGGSSSGTRFTLQGLKKDGFYNVRVTAVDESKYESLPSKEARFYSRPLNLRHQLMGTLTGNTYDLKIQWTPLAGPGIAVKKYDLYRQEKNLFLPVASTAAGEWTLRNLAADDTNIVEVRPVLDRGEPLEGNRVSIRNLFYEEQMIVSMRGAYIQSLGDFKETSETGYGTLVDFMFFNYFLKRLSFGIETGYFHFPGRDAVPFEKEAINRFGMVPLLARVQYGVSPIRRLMLSAECRLAFRTTP